MSKKRTIDSKIRSSQTFAGLTYRQRDLWQGLIAIADDQGRLPGTPAYIRSIVWPYDDISLAEVSSDLGNLAEIGNVEIYETGGCVYIQIVNWWKYQQSQWAGPSDYPAPAGWVDRCRYHGKGNQIIALNWDNPGGRLSSQLGSEVDSPLSCRDVNDEVKGNDEDEDEDRQHVPNGKYITAMQAERIFQEVTKLPTFPSERRDFAIDAICKIANQRGDTTSDYLKPFWEEWRSRKNKNGRPYPKTSVSWLDWAIAGDIPAITPIQKDKSYDELLSEAGYSPA